jgi:hypothetical protein
MFPTVWKLEEAGDDTAIKVHKFFEDYVYEYITCHILKNKRDIPLYEKRDARKNMRAEYRNAKIAIGGYTGPKVLMTLRGKNKWVK